MWATVKLVDVDALPPGTTTVRVRLADDPVKDYWMVLQRPQPELCTRSLGRTDDLVCQTDCRSLVDLHLRRITYPQAIRAGRLRVEGTPPELERRFVHWFRTSPFAEYVPGPHAGPDPRQRTDT